MIGKILLIVFAVFILASCFVSAQEPDSGLLELKGPYLGQRPPGRMPEIFAPDIISSGVHELDITISPDLNEILFSRSGFDWYTAIIKLKRTDGVWSDPVTIEHTEKMSCKYPFISPDGSKLFFNSNLPIKSTDPAGRISNIWISEREDNSWAEPKPLGPEINTKSIEMFPSIANNGNLYFSANYESGIGKFDVYYSKYLNGVYTKPENLGANINTSFNEFHAFIANDETYIIFDANRDSGLGGNDLYISFRRDNGDWTKAINMGENINTESSDSRPYVSPDGKYLFFCSSRPNTEGLGNLWEYKNFMRRINGPGNSSQDIYWVDASIIEDLKPVGLK